MELVLLIGRLLFASLFVKSGIGHLRSRESMAAYSRAMGAPAPDVLVPATGVMILAGGILTILGFWGDLGALLIAAFLLPTSYFMHGFWRFHDPQDRRSQETHFWKNISLVGGAFVLFFLFYEFGSSLDLTLGDASLFN